MAPPIDRLGNSKRMNVVQTTEQKDGIRAAAETIRFLDEPITCSAFNPSTRLVAESRMIGGRFGSVLWSRHIISPEGVRAMKRLRLIAVLILGGTPALAPTPKERKPAFAGQDSIEKILVAKEKQKWDALKKKDLNVISAFYTEDFLSVAYGATGVVRASKSEMIEAVSQTDVSGYTLKDFKLVRLGADCAVVTYKAVGKYPIFATSVWVKRDGRWLTAFYQATGNRVQLEVRPT